MNDKIKKALKVGGTLASAGGVVYMLHNVGDHAYKVHQHGDDVKRHIENFKNVGGVVTDRGNHMHDLRPGNNPLNWGQQEEHSKKAIESTKAGKKVIDHFNSDENSSKLKTAALTTAGGAIAGAIGSSGQKNKVKK